MFGKVAPRSPSARETETAGVYLTPLILLGFLRSSNLSILLVDWLTQISQFSLGPTMNQLEPQAKKEMISFIS